MRARRLRVDTLSPEPREPAAQYAPVRVAAVGVDREQEVSARNGGSFTTLAAITDARVLEQILAHLTLQEPAPLGDPACERKLAFAIPIRPLRTRAVLQLAEGRRAGALEIR